jgi:site-specific recombinase XerD
MIQIVSEHAEEAILHFHDHLASRGDLSDVSIGGYIAAIRNFASWYESWTGKCFQISSALIPALIPYQRALQERGVPATTIKRHIAVLKRLFEWAAVGTRRTLR